MLGWKAACLTLDQAAMYHRRGNWKTKSEGPFRGQQGPVPFGGSLKVMLPGLSLLYWLLELLITSVI